MSNTLSWLSFRLPDSAQNSMVEATQAYGIEEPSEAELQAQVANSNLIIILKIILLEF